MEISVLQSLIDRTSNQIENREGYLRFLKDCGEYDDKLSDVAYAKRDIAKLTKIQKALKKEIAVKLEVQRFMLDYKKQAAERRAVSKLKEME
jgi:hypothetical protein